MTSVWEETGYVAGERKFKAPPPQARFEGVRGEGSEWEAEIVKASGRRVWVFGKTRDEAVNKARSLVAAMNGSGK